MYFLAIWDIFVTSIAAMLWWAARCKYDAKSDALI